MASTGFSNPRADGPVRSPAGNEDSEASALARAGRFLGEATLKVGLLGRVLPNNLAGERLRAREAFAVGCRYAPSYTYDSADVDAVYSDLLRFAEHPMLDNLPLGEALRGRAHELALEAELVAFRGSRGFAPRAVLRFSAPSHALATRATKLASSWLSEPEPRALPTHAVDDADDPASLVSRLRQELDTRALNFHVAVAPGLSALAATGHDTVFVAQGRVACRETIERTVVHEIEGHVLPRVRSRAARHPLFRVGTARGTCEQEGYALLIEARSGLLRARRKRELALRHLLCVNMRNGADFADSVAFARAHGQPLEGSIQLAERMHRGGDGTNAGLGRELVYLASYLRVKDHLAREPEAELTLASGQIACAWLEAARGWR